MSKRNIRTDLNIDNRKAKRRLAWERSVSEKNRKRHMVGSR